MWCVINVRFQPDGSVAELRRRLRAAREDSPAYPDRVGFLLDDFSIRTLLSLLIRSRMDLAKSPPVPRHASTEFWLTFRWRVESHAHTNAHCWWLLAAERQRPST